MPGNKKIDLAGFKPGIMAAASVFDSSIQLWELVSQSARLEVGTGFLLRKSTMPNCAAGQYEKYCTHCNMNKNP